MKRRRVGAAYERSPADKVGEWGNRNTMILISAVITGIIFWFVVNWTVDGLFNFLATGGDDTKEKVFSSNHPMVILVKVFGSLLCIWGICKGRAK
jgi:heme/copper-type cytochrome/quinol oxidase subunit 2